MFSAAPRSVNSVRNKEVSNAQDVFAVAVMHGATIYEVMTYVYSR